MAPGLRLVPPWTDSDYTHTNGPSLRVGYADGFYIIRAPGGHIVGSTDSLEVLGQAIRDQADMGPRGSRAPFPGEPGCAGIFPDRGVAVDLSNITLEELDL